MALTERKKDGWVAMAMASIPARQHTCSCLPLQDGEVRRAFQRSLQKQGLKFKLGTKVGNAFQSFRPCCFARTAPLTGIDISVSGLVYCQLFLMQVASAEATHDGVNLTLQPAKGNGSTEMMSADVVLVSTGAHAPP